MNLRWFNNLLTTILAALGLYILLAPFLPGLAWWVRHDAPVKLLPAQTVAIEPPAINNKQEPQSNQLIIPSLGMRVPIYGGGIASLNKGVWRVSHSSTPNKGSNTVLAGHRFTYDGHAVFYHLDKVKMDDLIGLWWEGRLYEYRVVSIRVVPPTEVSVEDKTQDSILTIYTCTPLWNPKDRLVIQANQVGDPQ